MVRADSVNNTLAPAPTTDTALSFQEVYALIGSKCRTAHTALALAKRGQIRAIRISARTIRYSQKSVEALIAGDSK